MRIAFLPSSYLPDSVGGTEIYVHHLAQALVDAAHHIAVVYHAAPGSRTGEFSYDVVALPPYAAQRRADLYHYAADADPPGFEEFLTQWRPDIIHFHALTLGAGAAHARLAARHGIPYVVTYHTPTFSCRRGTLMRWGSEVCDGLIQPRQCAACVLQGQGWPRPLAASLALSPLPWTSLPESPLIPRLALPSLLASALETWRNFMDGAAHIVACAQWCKDVLVKNGIRPDKITVCRQALPGPARTRTLRLPLPPDRPLKLGFFGRFCHVKGPDLLLRAVDLLRGQGIDAVTELAGPIAPSDEAYARRLLTAHASHAIYRGVLRGADLTRWLDSLHLIVIPSRWLETGPLTLLEAWDRGIPVIGADRGGIRDFLNAAALNALLFAPDDPDSLAAAIRRAIDWSPSAAPIVALGGMQELADQMMTMYSALKLT